MDEFNAIPVWVQLVILLMVIIVTFSLLGKIVGTFNVSAPAACRPYLMLIRHVIIALLVSYLLINWWLRLPILSTPGNWSAIGRGAFIVFTMAMTSFFTRHFS